MAVARMDATETDRLSLGYALPGRVAQASGRSWFTRLPEPVVVDLTRWLDGFLIGSATLLEWSAAEENTRALLYGHLLALLCGVGVTVLSLRRFGFYDLRCLRSFPRQARMLLPALLIGTSVLFFGLALLGQETQPMHASLYWFGVASALLLGAHLGLSLLVRRWSQAGVFARRVAILGSPGPSAAMIERLAHDPEAYQITGLYNETDDQPMLATAVTPLRGGAEALVADAQLTPVDDVVIALAPDEVGRAATARARLASVIANIHLTVDLPRQPIATCTAFAGMPLVTLDRAPLTAWQSIRKSVFDRITASILLVVLAPLLLAVALAIRLDSPGPILFLQPRIGFNNRPFRIYKFRTMYHEMTDLLADRQTVRGDPRITRVGKWLRKLSLDELPQLLNVLDGSMSLVGPRPHAPNTKAAGQLFQDVVPDYPVRHRVKPGITGWAQVNGWRGETRTVEQVRKRVEFDLYYARNWSLLFDLRILVLTLLREVFSARAF